MAQARFQSMENINRYLEVADSLGQTELDQLRAAWHLVLPQPYEQAVAELDLTDVDVVRALHGAVEYDGALSNAEKHVLDHEISERSQVAVLKTAPEGWND